jgi:hypothetical protein
MQHYVWWCWPKRHLRKPRARHAAKCFNTLHRLLSRRPDRDLLVPMVRYTLEGFS